VAAGQDILEAVSQLCVPHACLFAVLDGPQENLAKGNTAPYPSTSHAAVYYPWLSANWAETAIPPSAAMAGLYCKVNREEGVWSSTARKLLEGGVHSIDSITADQQAQYESIIVLF
jgi:phage tail sheath protein FI